MKPVSFLSRKLLTKPAKMRGFAEFSVLEKWSEILPSYADFLRPVSLRNGTLRVMTNSSSAASNLKMQGPYLLSRINSYFGYAAVQEMKFEIKHFEVEPLTVKEQLAPSKEMEELALYGCEHIEDAELKASFAKLGALFYAQK